MQVLKVGWKQSCFLQTTRVQNEQSWITWANSNAQNCCSPTKCASLDFGFEKFFSDWSLKIWSCQQHGHPTVGWSPSLLQWKKIHSSCKITQRLLFVHLNDCPGFETTPFAQAKRNFLQHSQHERPQSFHSEPICRNQRAKMACGQLQTS